MDTVSLDLAFSRLGAQVAGRRPLCATAQDGSLVMVCQSSGFSRPDAGVLRYSARLSQTVAGRAQIEALRVGLNSATTSRIPVRLIIQTPASGRAAARVHMRADLVGSVADFDGDAFSVDFVRLPVEEPEPPLRRRKR
ncbi:MAG TPA: hypothetical protein VKO83_11265 [Steroidobacteraceae bacterium]|nr:hypothetical protein [Steroidobacteraceae bacterium]